MKKKNLRNEFHDNALLPSYMDIQTEQTTPDHFDHLAWGRGSWSLCLSCICLLAMHTLICVTFSLPPGVMGWLRLLLVALPGLFCLPFCHISGFRPEITGFFIALPAFRLSLDCSTAHAPVLSIRLCGQLYTMFYIQGFGLDGVY